MIDKIHEAAQTATFAKYGAFFAFSETQLKDGMQEGKEKKDYYHLCGAGLICLKANSSALIKELDIVQNAHIERMKDDFTVDQMIRYELDNHEYCITGDPTDTVDVLEQYGVTLEQVEAYIRRERL